MIVNDKLKFIFVHIPKSAGTSIATALSTVEGNNKAVVKATRHETLCDFISRTNFDYAGFKKFCIVRNPYARLYSLYRYLLKSKVRHEISSVECFEQFILELNDSDSWALKLSATNNQTDFFMGENGRIIANYIGNYEFLVSELISIKQWLGVDFELRHLNSSDSHSVDYREHYSGAMVDIVTKLYSKDLELLQYSFEKEAPVKRFML
ncbi:sulfotransferase family 2 domain-containing protein [Vibrio sp. WXL103]|uniref:sulfotransferase family 2 domain-containing protein n=1 Tax=Vibrio sp. WXL103 TaxID=3450710 RepID=UPI003EC8F696